MLNTLRSNRLLKNVLSIGIAEVSSKLFRLLATVVLARYLTPEDYGITGIVFMIMELAGILQGRAGFNSKLIQCRSEEFNKLANCTYYLSWLIGISLCIIQCITALSLILFTDNWGLIHCVIATSFVYLLYPSFCVPSALVYRSNNLNIIAKLNLAQGLMTSVISMGLAMLGFKYWSIIIPFIGGYILWSLVLNKFTNLKWRAEEFSLEGTREILSFAKNLMGVEALDKLRNNVDTLIVGSVLGIEAVGLYSFAFNAGLGLSISVVNTFTYSIYPNLASYKEDWSKVIKEYWRSIKLISMIIIPVILLQVLLAPWYVPIIYGNKWNSIIAVLMLICISAIPRPYKIAAGALVTLKGRPDLVLKFDLIFSFLLTIFIALVVSKGLIYVSLVIAIVHWIIIPVFMYLVWIKVWSS